MPDLETDIPDADRIAMLEPPVRPKRARRRQAEHPALLRQRLDPEEIVPVRSDDRQAVTLRQIGNRPGVVAVRVSQKNLSEFHPGLPDLRIDTIEVTARIDDRRGTAALTPNQ
jgi:hypothetical protein